MKLPGVRTHFSFPTIKILLFLDKSPNYSFKKRDGTDETLVKYYYDVS
jgi:hypothetical protein